MDKILLLLGVLLMFAALTDAVKPTDIVSVMYNANAPGAVDPAPPVATNTYPEQRSVGFQGDEAALEPRTGNATQIAGSADINGVIFTGPVLWDGQGGTLRLTNCVINAGVSTTGAIIALSGGRIEIDSCTLRVTDSNSSGVVHGAAVKIITNSDLSGAGDGINSAQPGSLIEGNWIHDLQQSPDCAQVHNDGVQIYAGQGDVTIRNNRIELPSTGCNGNAVVFTQGAGIGDIIIEGNYMRGGEAILKNQDGTMHVIGNTFVNNSNIDVANGFSCCKINFYSATNGTIGQWNNNINDLNLTIPQPQ